MIPFAADKDIPRRTVAPMMWVAAAVAAGIALGRCLALPVWSAPLIALLALITLRFTRFAGVARSLLFVATGIFVWACQAPPDIMDPDLILPPVASGRVVSALHFPQYSRLEVEINRFSDMQASASMSVMPVRVEITTPDSAVRVDDYVSFINTLAPPADDTSSLIQSRRRLLESHGIVATAWVKPQDISVTGHAHDMPARMRALHASAVKSIENSGLKPATAAFLNSILLGDRSHLPDGMREGFADAGLSHILALSGMHLGIIVLIITTLLMPLRLVADHRISLALALLAVWLYVVFTGLPLSAVRAAVMLTAVFAARLSSRRLDPLNALGIAMLCILTVDPIALFDPGLQLSFVCVLSFIAFEGVRFGRGTASGVIQAALTALVAVAGSWALTAWYFHRLPICFLPFNIVVCALLPVYIILALVYLLAAACSLHIAPLARLLDSSLAWLTGDILPGIAGTSLTLWVPALTVCLWLAALAAFVWWSRARKRSAAVTSALLAVAAVAAIFILPSERPDDTFIIRHNPHALAVAEYRDGLERRDELPLDSNRCFTLNNARWLLLTKANNHDVSQMAQQSCDYLVICKSVSAHADALIDRLNPSMVVLHSSLYPARADEMAEDIRSRGIPCHNMHADGPLRLPLAPH